MIYLLEYVKTLYDAVHDRWTFQYKTMRRHYDYGHKEALEIAGQYVKSYEEDINNA